MCRKIITKLKFKLLSTSYRLHIITKFYVMQNVTFLHFEEEKKDQLAQFTGGGIISWAMPTSQHIFLGWHPYQCLVAVRESCSVLYAGVGAAGEELVAE